MSRTIAEYDANDGNGKAVISVVKEVFCIDYYDDHGHHFFFEEFPNKSIEYVINAAENWAAGVKRLEDTI